LSTNLPAAAATGKRSFLTLFMRQIRATPWAAFAAAERLGK
jgi:hypothetical protein